jgi:hypothetical protein
MTAASTFLWQGSTGTWNTASDWNTGTVPNSLTTANVFINAAGSSAYTVTLDINASVRTLTVDSANATLNIGANTLTDASATTGTNNAHININAGTVTLAGGSIIALQNSSPTGITVGASGELIGFGTVSALISGSGIYEASGGTLDLALNVHSGATGLEIASGSGNELELDGSVSAATANATVVTFLGGSGVLDINNAANNFNGNALIKLTVGSDLVVADNDAITFGAATVTSASFNVSNHILTVNTSNGTFHLDIAAESGVLTGAIAHISGSDVFLSTACYLAGTRILTPDGEVAVEDLMIGDRVMTISGQAKRIKWIGTRAYDLRFVAGNRDILPIRIKRGALGSELPRRDLYLSPEHALFIDGVLVPAKALVNGVSIWQEWRSGTIEYYHVELAEHDVIYAEGTAAETYIDCGNRGMFQNETEFDALYPEDQSQPWAYCAPVVDSGPELDRVRRRIAEHAGPLAVEDALWRKDAGSAALASPAGSHPAKVIRLTAA